MPIERLKYYSLSPSFINVIPDENYGEEIVMAGVMQPLVDILSSPVMEGASSPDVVDAARILAKLSEGMSNSLFKR